MAKYRVVVVGCGGMSNKWFDYLALRTDTEVVGLVDIFIDAAKSMAERRQLEVPVFSDLEEAIEVTKPNVICDVTIPDSHRQVAQTALAAGCHILGEKPMGASLEDARAILHAANQSSSRYTVMQNRRYNQQIRAVRDGIQRGMIGKVGAIHADFFIGAHFGGFRDAMANPLILDMAIHTFDQARFISGADPVSVFCHEFNMPGSWYQGNASAVCLFEMNDGSVFTYRGSWSSEGFNTSWESDWRVIGSLGTLRWDGTNPPVCQVVDETKPHAFIHEYKKIKLPMTWEGQEGHWGCLDEMFAAIDEDRPAETDSKDNIKSVAMVFGAIESAKTGKKVRIEY
ncbi:Gfo/Idh/MocA family oxidoreductase [Alicyclobacillus fastidiosus]|uniref:Gfo/Idh/MocA family oxidoreductase n=1 Tax=Alicyclobacillus fastidiosus TaxID=392011 RepID=A0ABY6ZCH6_9BACL|nr:Gfo/Idh/MocA family oxidoreductase [Alicyclobacillus fastidiosus]WAH39821.1 Gfo/Idh/MocA family oxidoreductase [Alicyclobacillus fastidiosus]GMA61078.1 oxidoreductase [Alicyclobacillus fastidiosus]